MFIRPVISGYKTGNSVMDFYELQNIIAHIRRFRAPELAEYPVDDTAILKCILNVRISENGF